MGMVEELAAYIQANVPSSPWILPSVSPSTGNLFYHFMPNDPDRACCLYQFPGNPSQRTLGNKLAFEQPRLQIRNRSSLSSNYADYPGALLDAEQIRDLLQLVTNTTVSGTFYLAIRPMGSPNAQSLDPTGRPVFVTDYSVMKYPSE